MISVGWMLMLRQIWKLSFSPPRISTAIIGAGVPAGFTTARASWDGAEGSGIAASTPAGRRIPALATSAGRSDRTVMPRSAALLIAALLGTAHAAPVPAAGAHQPADQRQHTSSRIVWKQAFGSLNGIHRCDPSAPPALRLTAAGRDRLGQSGERRQP